MNEQGTQTQQEAAMRARAAWIKATLEAHGKKTLESEYRRFMSIYRETGQ